MKQRKGFTIIETVFVILIMCMIGGIAYGMIHSFQQQYNSIEDNAYNPVFNMRVINTIEETLNGCSSVAVTPEKITVFNGGDSIIINNADFSDHEEMYFFQRENTVVVSIGTEQYPIPIMHN